MTSGMSATHKTKANSANADMEYIKETPPPPRTKNKIKIYFIISEKLCDGKIFLRKKKQKKRI